MHAVLALPPTFPNIVVKKGFQENSRQTKTKDFVSGVHLCFKDYRFNTEIQIRFLLASLVAKIAGGFCINSLSRHVSTHTVGARSPTISCRED